MNRRGALVLLLMCAPAPAWAGFAPVVIPPQPPAPAGPTEEQLFADGFAKFNAHDFVGAVADFRAAYGKHPDRAYLLDIAQAYRLLKDCASAKQFYQAFLAASPANAPDRAVAERALVGIDACAAPPARPPAAAPPPGPPRIVELPPRGGSGALRVSGIVTAGAGIVAAGLAAVYGFRAHEASLDIENTLAHNGGTWTDALARRERDAQRFDDTAIGLSIGSAAAMIGGGVLWYLGRAHATTVLVTSEGRGVAVGVAGRF